jgi:hypothetical protein
MFCPAPGCLRRQVFAVLPYTVLEEARYLIVCLVPNGAHEPEGLFVFVVVVVDARSRNILLVR